MSDEWIKTLADRRRVKFTNQELDERAFLTAQVEGNKVVYSIVLSDAKNPLSREEVETHFDGELSKRSPKSNLAYEPAVSAMVSATALIATLGNGDRIWGKHGDQRSADT